MQLRPYRSQDCAALAALFHKTIHLSLIHI